ncbi:uncharacterized protein Z518_10662 [Rhinocladiella mackenziei CBS 650.93]|uniref:Rhinocladiella mackenziei CBS 650.93 unplaced genomic scaffold supercont1.9, whole genome shotgun sequence n=1 Tax=Rhinocladiella mackenziei CBS 650.93 TaxID=1442369 RepID=A0A0D2FEV1_9EURO|nr:uncharacterized protein Z518_10662 [Rhinocladiella mackenziei CBS 650.93]KIX00522.1 hypothetical protein Z518_10662 [Rhinocladiella mackenziei CBS 650.93]
MLSNILLAAAALAAVAHTQTIETSSASSVAASTTVSQVMPPAATASFNPAGIDSTTAFNWCHAQLNTCPQICGGIASQNLCDQNTFTYSCVCPNGTAPDCTAFIETLPFYICEETYIQCINNHPNDAQAQSVCADNEQCGTRNATAEALAATSAASASSAAATSSSAPSSASESGSATAASSTPSPTESGNAAMGLSQHITTGAFAAVLMAAFKLMI